MTKNKKLIMFNKKNTFHPLKKGDLIDIISPSSPVTKSEYKKITEFLAKLELKARFFLSDKLILERKKNDLFALDKNLRFSQLKNALKATDSKAIWCVRGGYGSSDLLNFLAKEKSIKQNKLFIGFSDLTSLGGFLAKKYDWQIIYGSMLTQLSQEKVTKQSEKKLLDLVFGKRTLISYNLKPLNTTAESAKNISSKLVGGCLSVILQSFCTINEINFKNKILLLEDIDENGERLDRFFNQLIQIFLHKKSFPKAILLGNFLQFVNERNKQKRIEKALENFAKNLEENNLKIPLFEDKTRSIGHSENNMAVIINQEAKIENNIFLQKFFS